MVGSGIWIRDSGKNLFQSLDPGVQKAPDPATLHKGCIHEGCTMEGRTQEGCTYEGCTHEGHTYEGCTHKGRAHNSQGRTHKGHTISLYGTYEVCSPKVVLTKVVPTHKDLSHKSPTLEGRTL